MAYATKTKSAENAKNYRANLRANGLCYQCRQPTDGKVLCKRCRDLASALKKENRKKGLCYCGNECLPGINMCAKCDARSKRNHAKRRGTGLCLSCRQPSENGAFCKSCQNKIRDKNQKLRKFVIDSYGGKCICCGESMLSVLCMDHKHNDGNEQRKSGIKGMHLYSWLVKHKFPSDFQVLCHSCNFAKLNKHTECPHQIQKREMLKKLGKIPLLY